MSRPFEQFTAVLVAVVLTATTFLTVVTVPETPAPHAAAAPMLA